MSSGTPTPQRPDRDGDESRIVVDGASPPMSPRSKDEIEWVLPDRPNGLKVAGMTLTCPCGAIELKAFGKPLAQFYCHCDDCRKMTSGAYAAESVHRADEVTVTRGSPAVWTLARNPRHYCATCGGRLFIEIPSLHLRGVNAFLLPPNEFRPQFHVNCSFAILPVRDDLTHFAKMPAAFGGTDEKVDW